MSLLPRAPLTRLAPIALFAFRRPDHTRRTLEALAASPLLARSELHLFSDGPRRADDEAPVAEVRRILDAFTGPARIHRHDAPANRGLANSVIAGVSSIIAEHDRVIVLEDDLLTTPDFLEFMNTGLEHFAGEQRVFSICGYNLPIEIPADYAHDAYFAYRNGSWGWATWRDRWTKVDWSLSDYREFSRNVYDQWSFNRGGSDLSRMLRHQVEGRIDSWSIRFSYSQFRNRGLALFPTHSRVLHIGADASGTHVQGGDLFDTPFEPQPGPWRFPDDVKVDSRIAAELRQFWRIPRREALRGYWRSWIDRVRRP